MRKRPYRNTWSRARSPQCQKNTVNPRFGFSGGLTPCLLLVLAPSRALSPVPVPARRRLRHLSGAAVADVADIRGVDTDGDGEPDRGFNFSGVGGGTDATVIGHTVKLPAVQSRYAVERELESAPLFSDCDMGLVLFVPWVNNMARCSTALKHQRLFTDNGTTLRSAPLPSLALTPSPVPAPPSCSHVRVRCVLCSQAESFSRVGPTMEELRERGVFASHGARIAVATPQKLPVDTFNEWCAPLRLRGAGPGAGCSCVQPGPDCTPVQATPKHSRDTAATDSPVPLFQVSRALHNPPGPLSRGALGARRCRWLRRRRWRSSSAPAAPGGVLRGRCAHENHRGHQAAPVGGCCGPGASLSAVSLSAAPREFLCVPCVSVADNQTATTAKER